MNFGCGGCGGSIELFARLKLGTELRKGPKFISPPKSATLTTPESNRRDSTTCSFAVEREGPRDFERGRVLFQKNRESYEAVCECQKLE